jgi:hypothetical protein
MTRPPTLSPAKNLAGAHRAQIPECDPAQTATFARGTEQRGIGNENHVDQGGYSKR